MKNRLDISESTAISMPMKNLLAIISAVAVGVWAYFGVLERITMLETKAQLSEKDLNQLNETLSADIEKNNEFRIKWPRGELGSPPVYNLAAETLDINKQNTKGKAIIKAKILVLSLLFFSIFVYYLSVTIL